MSTSAHRLHLCHRTVTSASPPASPASAKQTTGPQRTTPNLSARKLANAAARQLCPHSHRTHYKAPLQHWCEAPSTHHTAADIDRTGLKRSRNHKPAIMLDQSASHRGFQLRRRKFPNLSRPFPKIGTHLIFKIARRLTVCPPHARRNSGASAKFSFGSSRGAHAAALSMPTRTHARVAVPDEASKLKPSAPGRRTSRALQTRTDLQHA